MSARLQSVVFAVAASMLLSACGGGGGGGSTAAGGSLPSTGGNPSGTLPQGSASATFALSMQQYTPVNTSAKRRRIAFVSPATAQISLAVVSVNGVAQTGAAMTFAVSPSSPNCAGTNGFVTCNLSATIPIGNDVLSASTLDANGHSLGSSTITASVAQNATNRITLAIGGTINNLQMYLSKSSFTSGTIGSSNVIIVPLDQSGAEIVNPGNYDPPITVASSSSVNGHVSLVTNGTNTGQNATIASPNDQVVVSYDGVATTGSASITASASANITASRTVSVNTPAFSASPSGPQFVSSSAFIFTSSAQTGTVTVSGGTPPYQIASSDTTVANVSPASGTGPFTVSAVGYGSTGSATITVNDSATGSWTIPVTFIAPPVSLAVGTCGGSSCSPNGATYAVALSGASAALNSTIVTAQGGTGTFSYFFISSGTMTSTYASVSQAGSTFTITPSGFGNDAIIVSSGNQSTYFAITAGASAFGQALPNAIGLLVEGTVGKFYSATLPASVTNATAAPAPSGFIFNSGGPSIAVTPTLSDVGTGVFTFTSSLGTSIARYTVFSLQFGTYAGTGATSSSEQTSPGGLPGADEQFSAALEQDIVTVGGFAGALSASSSSIGVVTTSVAGNLLTVTAVGSGTAAITVADTATGASASYTVSVTTTTIPVAGIHRHL
jgi:hypothetical protein